VQVVLEMDWLCMGSLTVAKWRRLGARATAIEN